MIEVQEKFIRAYEELADGLYRYCYFRVGSRETAQDILQETFMKSWEYIVKGEEVSNFKAFFYKIMRNKIIDEYRKKKHLSLDVLAEDGFVPAFDEQDRVEDKIDGARAVALLRQLPLPYREAVTLRFVEEMDLSEIADITGEPPNTIAVRVHRGLEKLKKLYYRG